MLILSIYLIVIKLITKNICIRGMVIFLKIYWPLNLRIIKKQKQIKQNNKNGNNDNFRK